MQGLVAMPVGLFVGLHILGAAVAMLAFGSTAIWLGYRRYDAFGRYATITWAVLAILLVLVAIAMQSPTINDVAGNVFISLLLLMFGTVLLIAVWRRVAS